MIKKLLSTIDQLRWSSSVPRITPKVTVIQKKQIGTFLIKIRANSAAASYLCFMASSFATMVLTFCTLDHLFVADEIDTFISVDYPLEKMRKNLFPVLRCVRWHSESGYISIR